MPSGKYIRTEKHRKAISQGQKKVSKNMCGDNNPSRKYGPWNKGKKWSKKMRKKLSLTHQGPKPWLRGRKLSKKHRKNLSLAHLGHKLSKKTKKKMSLAKKGKSQPWSREKWFGVNNPRWVGGPEKYGGYTSEFLTKIRYEILERDKYCCHICRIDSDLIVHHIDHNKLNNKSSNLVTLCRSCHTKVHMTKNTKYSDILNRILRRK